jgi:hypothetical protein
MLMWFSVTTVLPILLLIDVTVWPPGPRTEWQITLVRAIIWGTLAGGVGTILGRGLGLMLKGSARSETPRSYHCVASRRFDYQTMRPTEWGHPRS